MPNPLFQGFETPSLLDLTLRYRKDIFGQLLKELYKRYPSGCTDKAVEKLIDYACLQGDVQSLKMLLEFSKIGDFTITGHIRSFFSRLEKHCIASPEDEMILSVLLSAADVGMENRPEFIKHITELEHALKMDSAISGVKHTALHHLEIHRKKECSVREPHSTAVILSTSRELAVKVPPPPVTRKRTRHDNLSK